MHPGTGLVLVGALVSAGSERQQRDNPAPAEEDARSPKNDFAFSFSVFPHTLFGGGVSIPFYCDFFPSCSPACHLSPPHHSLLCHQLPFFAIPCHVPGCHPGWFSLIRAVTSLTWGLTSPCPPVRAMALMPELG